MKKLMFAAALLFATAAHPVFASDLTDNSAAYGEAVSTTASAGDQVSNPGIAMQVGRLFGTLLKMPVAAGQNLMTGFKAGFSSGSQESASEVASSDSTSMSRSDRTHASAAPVERHDTKAAVSASASGSGGFPFGLSATLRDRLASARQSLAQSHGSSASHDVAMADQGGTAVSGYGSRMTRGNTNQ